MSLLTTLGIGPDDQDPAAQTAPSLADLQGKAIETLKDVLLQADSDDVKRKAAVDILNFKAKAADKPVVTEEQLEYLGRIIVEAEAVRVSLIGGQAGTPSPA